MSPPLPWRGVLLRVVIALLSFVLVSSGLLAMFGTIALAIEWDIPEGHELLGPSSVFDRNGVPLARFAAEVERRPVPLDEISPHLQRAVVATEDHRFYTHQGVDPFSVLRAVVRNVRTGGIAEGGSTLTQQYVKNVYVGPERTLYRKVREAVVALQLEKERTKDEILEAYLNRVYFGEGAYGAEAAAITYFSKPAAELTLPEAALLASLLTKPSRFSPRTDPDGALARRNLVLDEIARYSLAPRHDVVVAKAAPLGLVERTPSRPAFPYFIEEVRRQLLQAYGPETVYNGGLVVNTTLDVAKQFELERRVAAHLPPDPAFDAGVVALDPRSGDVLAAWSGRSFEASQVDLALRQEFGRPSGSTFKVFALVAALEEGKTLATRYPAPGSIRIADWRVRGGGGCGGRCTLLEATVRSANTVFAQLGRDVGPESFTVMARRLGVRSPLKPDDLTQVLGTSDVTPLDMASAFGALANMGVACPARVILTVANPDGSLREAPDPRQPSPEEKAAWAERLREAGFELPPERLGRCYRAVAPSVARDVTRALEEAVARGTGKKAQLGRPQAGKTGTTTDSKEVWFVGYTPDMSVGVFFGARDSSVPLVGIPGCRQQCYGGDLPAVLWRDAAEGLLANVPPTPFPEPGEDFRVGRDRRRLGPAMRPPPRPRPTEVPEPSERVRRASPTPSPSPSVTTRPSPSRSPSPSPSPTNPLNLLPP